MKSPFKFKKPGDHKNNPNELTMDDYNQLAWEQGQITRYPSRGIRSFSRSDHSIMIASDDKDVMTQAMKTLGLEPEDLEVPINNI